MHIDSIIIDGFKSYSTCTVIGPLDPHFNAVTGLNGSGKSNVLDSLCFALGITDLNCVRVSKLDDLIYKHGQAGITKASVTVVFNNRRFPSPFPDNYRKMPEVTVTRQIALGGRNRYFLNGHPTTPKAIADFFQSARMNVNNPRFLIMQGCVTKVVNMKPRELLSLIEEASGTRIYESKRAAAVKLMARKDQKLEQIRKILKEEIEPAMQKLKDDRDDLIRWNKVREEANRLERFDVAYKYWVAKEKASVNTNKENLAVLEKTAIQQDLECIEDKYRELKKNFDTKNKEIEQCMKPIADIRERKDTIIKEISKLESDLKIFRRDLEEAISSSNDIRADIKRNNEKLDAKKKATKNDSDALTRLMEIIESNKAKVSELESIIGIGSSFVGGGIENTLGGTRRAQLKSLRTALSKMEADEHVMVNAVKYNESEIQQQQKVLSVMSKSLEIFQDSKKDIERKRSSIQKQLDNVVSELEKFGGMKALDAAKTTLNELLHAQQKNREITTALDADLSRYRINCNVPPSLGTPSSVDLNAPFYGQAFDLFSLNTKNRELYSLPAHVLFGYKLHYLIVRDKECGKAIFEANGFSKGSRRVTILPLNDLVVGRIITDSDVKHCRELVDLLPNDTEHVVSYTDILKFDPDFSKLAQYIAGNVLICSSSEIARKISYQADRSKAFPTATFQGDRFDVGGSMSGGSNTRTHMVLLIASKLKEAKEKAQDAAEQISRIKSELLKMQEMVDHRDELKKQLDMCDNDLKSLTSRLNSSDAMVALKRIEELQKIQQMKNQAIAELRTSKTELTTKIENLEAEILDWDNNKAKNETDAKKTIKILKADIKRDSAKLDTMVESMSAVKIYQSNLERQILTSQKELLQEEISIAALEESISKLNEQISENNSLLAKIDEQMATISKQLDSTRKDANSMQVELDRMSKKKNQMILRLKVLEYEIQEIKKDAYDASTTIDKLTKENPWIADEEENFNRRGSAFDFDNLRLETVSKRLGELQQLKYELSRKVNRKAQQLYEKTETDYRDLISKKNKVEEDRNKIQNVIAELDVKKHENVNQMFSRINKYFSDIFHILLGNAQAKLVPVNGNILNGIEMKIGFNDKWKNSLSELSGGQRSLLALSLIFAMLKVRPAPIYILDEIDAALDLSHTQNIGKMIKTQFPNSQFLIVSLKEGMFSNANVIFKTRFVDGASTIMRHALTDKRANKRHKEDN